MGSKEMTGYVPETIAAVSTAPGSGGVAIVRLSGPEAISILSKCWKGKNPMEFASHSIHLGWITDEAGEMIDHVTVGLYRSPNSYTGEDVVEIGCHGSQWIQKAILHRLIEYGARVANGGEFTQRAFFNGRLDLAQAEAVADMIAASSRAAARLASSQLKGDFSRCLEQMRERLIDLGSLLELELDFSEEDVEFAERSKLIEIASELLKVSSRLASSYKAGNAFRNGVPVVIAGVPNVGKSTLLNALAGDDKAIVSDLPGTTRDVIEETVEIGGLMFRFQDTAGLRKSTDIVENIGVEKALKKIDEARIVIRLFDPTQALDTQKKELKFDNLEETDIIDVMNKADIASSDFDNMDLIKISAKTGDGIDKLKDELLRLSTSEFDPMREEIIVTNARHYEALKNAESALTRLIDGLNSGISADFLAQDVREVTHHLGTITGQVTTDDLLSTIFARYCIGK